MFKLYLCALVFAVYTPLVHAQAPNQPALATLKNTVDIAGIRLGISTADAKRAIESAKPEMVIKPFWPGIAGKPLDLFTSKRVSGWIATRDTPACKSAASDCEETIRVQSVDDKVYLVSYTRSFASNEAAPPISAVQAALREKYGALAASSWPSTDNDNIIERGFETNGEETPEACVAISDPAPPGGRWLYGFASACDWIFNAEILRDRQGLVRTLNVLLGDAQAAYQAFGGLLGSHKQALRAVVVHQRERNARVTHEIARK